MISPLIYLFKILFVVHVYQNYDSFLFCFAFAAFSTYSLKTHLHFDLIYAFYKESLKLLKFYLFSSWSLVFFTGILMIKQWVETNLIFLWNSKVRLLKKYNISILFSITNKQFYDYWFYFLITNHICYHKVKHNQHFKNNQ